MNIMLKSFLSIFILFLSATELFSLSFDTEKCQIVLSNDCFGGELALSRDDYRSYGVGTGLYFDNGLFFDLNFYGFTERAKNTRTDELLLHTGWTFSSDTAVGLLSFSPFIGGRLIGNTGGQQVQNLVHQIFGFKQVDFIYDTAREGASFSADLLFGTSGLWEYSIVLPEHVLLNPSLGAIFEFSMPSGITLGANAALELTNAFEDMFRLSAGYTGYFTDFPGETVDLAVSQEAGFYIGWSVQTGILGYQAVLYPATKYANGYISLNIPLGGAAGGDYVQADFILDYTLDLICFQKQMRILFPIADAGGLTLLPYIDYEYGDVINDFKSITRQIRLIQLSAGAEISYRPEFFNSPVEVFAGFAAGFRLEKYWDLADYIDYHPGLLLQPQTGIRTIPFAIFPNSGVFNKNTRYGLSLSYGFQYMPMGNMYIDYQHRVSIGLDLWCDY